MNVEIRNADGGAVLKVSGCLDTVAAADFKQAVDGIAAEAKQVTFDFSDLEFICSSALRVLVALGKRLEVIGGGITITGANEVVRDVFDATGLVEVFAVR